VAKGGNIARVAGRRLDKPRLRVVRKTWPGYVALYRDRKGVEVIVKSITEPPETRKFKVYGGLRTFTRVKYKQHLQEVLIVARATKSKPKNKRAAKKTAVVTDDEIDELESVDELEEDEDLEDDDLEEEDEEDEEDEDEENEEDEDEPDDEEEEDDEDEDEDEEEAPPKRSKKPRQSRAAAEGKVGSNEIAQKAGIDSRTLRMVLRKHNVKKDPETRRYQWDSWNNKTVKQILKWLKDGEADEIKTESLKKLKETQEAKRAASKKDGGTKKGKTKKRKRVVEDEDDE
jgi:hypothetical protein